MAETIIKRHKGRGYTLVEILIGVFILSIGLVSILGVFPVGIRIVHKIKRTTMLCNFAQGKTAEFQAYANPMGTLCFEDNAYKSGTYPVNPAVDITNDNYSNPNNTPGRYGILGDRKDAAKNFWPKGAAADDVRIRGAGRFLHWKIHDFSFHVFNKLNEHRYGGTTDIYHNLALYRPGTGKNPSYYDSSTSSIRSATFRMGFTQNQRRHEWCYGFTRKYIIEVWEGSSKAKTDDDFSMPPDKLSAYYAFGTAIWNPHIFYSAEWSPVLHSNPATLSALGIAIADQTYLEGEGCKYNFGTETATWQDQTQHDYFWPWANPLEGWGFVNDADAVRYIMDPGEKPNPNPPTGKWPWF
jgi:type II secretory pathway pseudopilin PulG